MITSDPPLAIPQPKEQQLIDVTKTQSCQFDVNEIPSPSRSRAKKQKAIWADADIQETAGQVCAEVAQQKVTEEDAAWPKWLSRAPNVAQQQVAEEEAASQNAQEVVEEAEAAPLKKTQAKWLREMKAMADLAEADRLCVETFLASVKSCASHERVRTPIKGTFLYTRHMIPSRPQGTRVNVKETSFESLGTFLRFLEDEGLLSLKPGLSDPVVCEIHFESCRQYRYNPQQNPCSTGRHSL